MTDRDNIVKALEDIATALNDPDADYNETELAEIAALSVVPEARLQLTED